MIPAAQHWKEQAQYDLDTARAMLNAGRYLYVLFCCQQSCEKAIKAIVTENTGQMPPRIHSLPRLAELAQVKPDAGQAEFLAELSAYYIQTRYPEDIRSMGASVSQVVASEVLRKTEEIVSWLQSILM